MKARKIRLWVFSIIGYAVIFVLLVSAVFVMISSNSDGGAFVFGYSVMWVKTDSMNPTIPERSYILVEKAEAEEVGVGDVIVFVSDDPSIEGQRNVHRVKSVLKDEDGSVKFVTRGDNPVTNVKDDDYPASGDKLLGKYSKTLKFLSVIGRLLSNTVGIFVIIVLIISVLLVIYLPEITRIIKKAEEIKAERNETMDELVRLEVERLKANGGADVAFESGKCETTASPEDLAKPGKETGEDRESEDGENKQ